MLTGELPFTDPSPQELALLHRYETPPSPREINPEISTELEDIIIKVLSKEPSSRYRTADQLGRIVISFTEMLDTQTQVEIPASPPEDKDLQAILNLENKKPSKQWLTILLGLLSLISVGGLIPFWIWVYFQLN
jgi:serine/threonine-protein kinase